MKKELNTATNIGLGVNIFLFAIKAAIGVLSNSIAVISEAVNSLTDIISSLAIKYSVRISSMQPDHDHQFGHNAAQPIAAFIVAVFAFVVGIKIIEESVKRIIEPQATNISSLVYIVLGISIITKLILSRYQFKVGLDFGSPALKAASVDSLNDVLASAIALIGVIFTVLGYMVIDGIAGVLVALFIFKTGYEVARENIDYLMGKSADEQLVLEIAKKAIGIEGVKGFNDLRTYHVGDKLHVEIHIEVDKELSTSSSHNIGTEVAAEIQKLEKVQKAFVHIDPI
ncbi:MAG: cation diffusion facilitator family transporter [Bacteroidetes bacterium]|nr:cation diffusion facilitator family transporter [Bacteroidota bacterium]MBU1679436.1 cation diffusion facilitator family transporter [Bacteroidota bacterium]